MAKTIQQYETTMILNTKKGEDGINALVEKFKNLISENGTIDNVDDWGKRRLAYEIEDEQEGYYVMITFTSKPDFPAELDRIYNITDGVLRSLTVAVEE
ncbi:MAG TPA: 30S ribosomal protein S6 [Ruminococcaceae bacterium]|nr:30S ribosomal protein S6 [Oscillospiraceae bacterium]MDD5921012.1 30S ribosomal protein S6 [Oscillospiraceae bacterium]HAG56913.1 30S ribosomal protein S6 [Oscillospiraceae bacterium]HCB65380.1 30S ribosomal protein S6 [Oscillospiraceae bacterium]HCU32837.1 30S ribosomal protein S6 [Oscillospiraceae bacterium]